MVWCLLAVIVCCWMFDIVVCCSLWLLSVDCCCWLCSLLRMFLVDADWCCCCVFVVDYCCGCAARLSLRVVRSLWWLFSVVVLVLRFGFMLCVVGLGCCCVYCCRW